MQNEQGIVYYHGTSTPDMVLDAVIGGGKLRNNFHLSPDINVARNYGSSVVAIELEGDLSKAHYGIINKEGNYNAKVGNSVEVVLKDDSAIVELYHLLVDAQVVH